MSDSSAPAETKNAPAGNGAPANAAGRGKRRVILGVIALLFVLAGLGWYLLYVFVFSLREVTDDAYVNGNQVALSSQVDGTVVAILADDTQRVEAGQVLVRFDSTDAEIALARARSTLANAVRQVRQQTAMASQYDAEIAARRLDLARAEADLKRRKPLLPDRAIAPEEVAHANDAVATARAALELAMQQAAAAHALVDGTAIADNATVMQAKAAFRDAWIHAERNAVLAPVSGYVAQRSVQVGSSVRAGQPLLTIVPLHDLWVDANFKESQLAHVRIGQPVRIESDLYGGDVDYRGTVVGLGAGSGSAFALLPPQNASGNWIKVVQRVPVRISLDPNQLERYPLRVGLSTTVTVDTHDRNGLVLAAAPVTAPVAQTTVYDRDLAKAEAEADAVVAANLADH